MRRLGFHAPVGQMVCSLALPMVSLHPIRTVTHKELSGSYTLRKSRFTTTSMMIHTTHKAQMDACDLGICLTPTSAITDVLMRFWRGVLQAIFKKASNMSRSEPAEYQNRTKEGLGCENHGSPDGNFGECGYSALA